MIYFLSEIHLSTVEIRIEIRIAHAHFADHLGFGLGTELFQTVHLKENITDFFEIVRKDLFFNKQEQG